MRKRLSYCLFGLSLVAGLVGCVKDVTMDAMEEPQLVVECILTDEPVQTLWLTYTKGASRAEAPDLPEATAVLTDLTEGKEVGRFARAADGSWQLAYAALPTHRYRLDVTVPGRDPVWAEQTMPSGAAHTVVRHFSYGTSSSTSVTSISTEYKYEQGTYYQIENLPDYTWVYALDYDKNSGEFKIAEEICSDFPFVDDFNVMGTYAPEVLPYKEWLYGNPCDGWALYPHLMGCNLHRRYLRLRKTAVGPESSRREFLISGNFEGEYYRAPNGVSGPEPDQGRVVFASVSEDYDKYLQEAFSLQEYKQSADLSALYLRDNIHSNIVGGLGIFGAIVQTPQAWRRSYSPVNPEVVWDDPMTAPKSRYPDGLPLYLFF